MNDFQVERWKERWMISPLCGLEWGGTRSADIVTNTLTKATKPGWISKGQRGGMCSSGLNRRSSCRHHLCASVYTTDNYLSRAINFRLGDNADGLPGEEWWWKEASRMGLERIVSAACVCARCGYGKAKRTGAVKWEDAPGDFMWTVPPLSQPRLWRWNKFLHCCLHSLPSMSWEIASILKKEFNELMKGHLFPKTSR